MINEEFDWGIHTILAQELENRFAVLKKNIIQVALVGADGQSSLSCLKKHYPQLILSEFDGDATRLNFNRSNRCWRLPFQKKIPTTQVIPWDKPLDKAYDLLWSNLALIRANCPMEQVFHAWAESIIPNGVLYMTHFGPDTARELVDYLQARGVTCELLGLSDMHDLGDALSNSGFLDVVTDMQKLTLNYNHAITLKRDLLSLGLWQHIKLDIDKKELCQILEEGLHAGDLKNISLEIIYAHAIRNQQLSDGRSVMQFMRKK